MLMQLLKSAFGKAALATAVLGGALFFAAAPNAQANERAVVRYDTFRLHEAIVHRGFYSPPANYWRFERREAIRGYYDRFGCWHRY
jgi:hypothetical protein